MFVEQKKMIILVLVLVVVLVLAGVGYRLLAPQAGLSARWAARKALPAAAPPRQRHSPRQILRCTMRTAAR